MRLLIKARVYSDQLGRLPEAVDTQVCPDVIVSVCPTGINDCTKNNLPDGRCETVHHHDDDGPKERYKYAISGLETRYLQHLHTQLSL